jgi:hypothetical protein
MLRSVTHALQGGLYKMLQLYAFMATRWRIFQTAPANKKKGLDFAFGLKIRVILSGWERWRFLLTYNGEWLYVPINNIFSPFGPYKFTVVN